MRGPPARYPTLAQQAVRFRHVQPDSRCSVDRGGSVLTWVGVVQPTPMSSRYRVRIVAYRSTKKVPQIFVESPALSLRDGAPPPHLYSFQEARLCLWYPGRGEWSRQMWLADSVLLWASLWLFFYEVWLATGEWLGGGEHPTPKKDDERTRRPATAVRR